MSRLDKQSSSFRPGHPYFTQGNSVVVMSSRRDGGVSNQDNTSSQNINNNMLKIPGAQMHHVASAQFIDDEMYEISSTKRSQENVPMDD